MALREQRAVHLFRAVSPCPPHDDLIVSLVPFQDRPGPYPEALANLGWYGYLPLRGELGFCDCHHFTLPG
jgi:hypothetical protein